jgi:uncharacterized peroxidase-related enzyme
MAWIKVIEYKDATGKLKKMYDRTKGPDDNIDNVLMIHSLRPHTLKGHMELYKNVLHNSNNTLPKWYLETIGVYVSYLNECAYCYKHHFTGLQRLLNDDERSEKILKCVKNDRMNECFENAFLDGLNYAKKLTSDHKNIEEEDINRMRQQGFSDGEILEINQVVSYFNYVNRSVLGLGVDTEGDILGLSPNDDGNADNWGHK